MATTQAVYRVVRILKVHGKPWKRAVLERRDRPINPKGSS